MTDFDQVEFCAAHGGISEDFLYGQIPAEDSDGSPNILGGEVPIGSLSFAIEARVINPFVKDQGKYSTFFARWRLDQLNNSRLVQRLEVAADI
ncbi:hypothetical protein NWF32_31120 [Pseudomonas qingdaonensis]|nr:hypothetical protein [Pseudomonas qingdaonensis]